MIAVDTNIIVRIFIDDLNTLQVKAARNLVRKVKQVYLTHVVIVEMVWVLMRAYQLPKPNIVNILHEICENAAFVVDDKTVLLDALTLFKNNTVEFSDCMILATAKLANVERIYTFDAKFACLEGVERL